MFRHRAILWWFLTFFLASVLFLVACAEPGAIPEEPAAEEQAPEDPAAEEPAVDEPAVEEEAPAEEVAEEPVAEEAGEVPVSNYDYGFGGEPVLCDPENPALVPIAQISDVEEVESSILDGDIAQEVQYENEFGQIFVITVHSLNGEASRRYLEEVQVCFEAVEAGPPSGIEAVSPSPDGALLATLLESSDFTFDNLLAAKDEFVAVNEEAGEIPTLASFLEWIGLDPTGMQERATQFAQEEIDRAREAGTLSPEAADELIFGLQEAYDEMFYGDTDLAVLNKDIIAPEDDYDRDLTANPENVVVEVEWANAPQESVENYSVFFAIDPTVGRAKKHWYNWLNRTYINARLYVYEGKAGPHLYKWDGSDKTWLKGISKRGPGWSSWVSASSPTSKWFKLLVYGYDSSNRYYLIGSWRGTGFRSS